MRTLVISDIHSNADALQAVLADAGSFDRAWCLGDVIGYGPDPNECIQMLEDLPDLVCILGNHDAAAMGFIDTESFNREASAAVHIQERLLTEASREFLESLEVLRVEAGVTLAHGSPRNPIWEYILSAKTAKENFLAFETQVCLVGHSHIPVIFADDQLKQPEVLLPASGDMWRSEKQFILNPARSGSRATAARWLLMSFGMTWRISGVFIGWYMIIDPCRSAFWRSGSRPDTLTAWRRESEVCLRNKSGVSASYA